MPQNTPLEKELNEMLAAGDFEHLPAYADETTWNAMNTREKDLLGLLFVAQGAFQLIDGHKEALNSLNLATKIAPTNALIFYRQAVAFSAKGNNVQCIILACKALEKAVEIDPNFFEAWSLWGTYLLRRGVFVNETTFLDEADQKFAQASLHVQGIGKPKLATLYGHWALCWHQHGKMSGEACDYRFAIDKYRQAAEYGLSHPDFWNDYAEVKAELARLLCKPELYLEGIELYTKARELDPHDARASLSIAICFQRIYEATRDHQYFHRANEAFSNISQQHSDDLYLWLNWALLIVELGKERRDVDLLQMSLEKFAKADACDPNNSEVLSRWGEAQGLIGSYSDRVDLLREAEAKIIKSLEIDPDNADTWYMYGACLSEMGRYFSDTSYYHQAIDKLKYGLSLNPNHPMLLHTIALAHFAIGELRSDSAALRQALDFFPRILECTNNKVPSEFWNDWGVTLMKYGEMVNDQNSIELAIEKFERAINFDVSVPEFTTDPEWFYNLGCAWDFLGDFTEEPHDHEKAVQVLSQLIEHHPDWTHVRYNLALALSHLAELTDDIECYHKALHHFQELVEEEHEDGVAWNDWGLALVNLAELVHETSDPEKSQELYTQAEGKFMHAIGLGSIPALYNLACLYSLVDNVQGAVHYLERANVSGGLPPLDDMLHDSWLDNLRQTPQFRHFLSQISRKDNKA